MLNGARVGMKKRRAFFICANVPSSDSGIILEIFNKYPPAILKDRSPYSSLNVPFRLLAISLHYPALPLLSLRWGYKTLYQYFMISSKVPSVPLLWPLHLFE